MTRIPIGSVVTFSFTLHRVTLSEPIARRAGVGVVVDDQDYSVWPCPGYAVRVTESDDYHAGAIVHVTSTNVALRDRRS